MHLPSMISTPTIIRVSLLLRRDVLMESIFSNPKRGNKGRKDSFRCPKIAAKSTSRRETEWRPDRDLNPGRSLDRAA